LQIDLRPCFISAGLRSGGPIGEFRFIPQTGLTPACLLAGEGFVDSDRSFGNHLDLLADRLITRQ
jgi:hypothetical protein